MPSVIRTHQVIETTPGAETVTPGAYARAALLIPLGVVALLMSPMLLALVRHPDIELLVSFGVPQYFVFATILAVVARGKDERQLTKLALWAPVLFVPVLVGPFVWEADTLDDAARVAGLMGAIGLGVGYFCVAITLGIWRLSRYGHRGPAGVGLAGKEHAG